MKAAHCLLALWLCFAADVALAQNRVLELAGDCIYVELPPNIFKDLDEVTAEGWVNWEGEVGGQSVLGLASKPRSDFAHCSCLRDAPCLKSGPDLREAEVRGCGKQKHLKIS
ncbi:MAG: hypothetical protein HY674_17580 [Chloroflexi bacterium]|nr:hypothetical protein [Chloroflexota bacterium]